MIIIQERIIIIVVSWWPIEIETCITDFRSPLSACVGDPEGWR
jgi:hypothetical protein